MRNISGLDDAARRMLELLVAVGRRNSLRDPLAQLTETLELTPPQLHGVMWLGQDGPLPMGELARRVGVTEKTITGIVDRLEREGYAQRERDPGDRRVVHVEGPQPRHGGGRDEGQVGAQPRQRILGHDPEEAVELGAGDPHRAAVAHRTLIARLPPPTGAHRPLSAGWWSAPGR